MLLPFLLAGIHLQIEKYQLRKEVKELLLQDLAEHDLRLFTVHAAKAADAFEWEHESEFRYRGEMYDVVRTEVIGDSIRYHCFHDKAESKFERKLERIMADLWPHHPEQQRDNKRVHQFLKKLFAPPFERTERVRIPRFRAEIPHRQPHYTTRLITPPSPPPERMS